MNAFNDILGGVGNAADALFLGGAVRKSHQRNKFADYLEGGDYEGAQNYALKHGSTEYAQMAAQRGQTGRQERLDQNTFFVGALQQLKSAPAEQRPVILSTLVPWAKRVGADDDMIANVVEAIDDDNELDALIGGLGGASADKETFGTSPQFVRGPDGKVRAVQFGSKGNVKQQDVNGTPIPLEQRYEALDQGRDRIAQGYALAAPEMKGAQGYASGYGREVGKQTGAAQFNLPRVAQNAAQTVDIIDQILTHPGLDSRYGLQGTLTPAIPGTAGADFEALRNQLRGKAFLAAFETLKGGGAITEIEGQKATEAISRAFDQKQSKESARAALAELRDIVGRGVERSQQQAQTPNPFGGGQPGASPDLSGMSDAQLEELERQLSGQ